ncbi:MAG: hypothetical protein ABSG18_25880 [Steroidobacteraceae bacterium]|jgi:hypothetical protein
MKKFAIVLAAFVSLGLFAPAFAEEKKDMKMEGHHDKVMIHHHHHHHHKMVAPR